MKFTSALLCYDFIKFYGEVCVRTEFAAIPPSVLQFVCKETRQHDIVTKTLPLGLHPYLIAPVELFYKTVPLDMVL